MKKTKVETESAMVARELVTLARQTYLTSLGNPSTAATKELADLYAELTEKASKSKALTQVEQAFIEWIEGVTGIESFEEIRACKHETLEQILKRGYF